MFSLEDWEVNMVECKLKFLFLIENKILKFIMSNWRRWGLLCIVSVWLFLFNLVFKAVGGHDFQV
jgi:hypothetical protein